jgi:hypothetical protein
MQELPFREHALGLSLRSIPVLCGQKSLQRKNADLVDLVPRLPVHLSVGGGLATKDTKSTERMTPRNPR